MNIKQLKEELNDLLTQKVELRMANDDLTEIDELLEAKREELRQAEAEIKKHSVEVGKKEEKMEVRQMNQEFVKELKEGKDLGEMELRTVSGEGVHHAMGTIDGGADWSGTRLETLSQTIVRKMGEQAVLVNYMPFQQQNGKLKIACSSNTHSVAMVSEGEQFGLKDYKLTYKTADLVKFGQQSIITNELLEDSQLAVQNHIVQETSADYARALSDLFLNGNVEGKFEGILNAKDAKITTLPQAGAFTANSLKEAYFSLPVEVREAQDLLFIAPTATIKALDMLEDSNGRALLHDGQDAQMNGRYFQMLYNAKVVECQVESMPEGIHGVFVSPSKAVHCGLGRQLNIKADTSKRAEYDEVVIISSLRACQIVKDGNAIAILKDPEA